MRYVDINKLYPTTGLSAKQKEVRELAANNFEAFIRLVAPYQMLGACHVELCKWIQTNDDVNKLVLWPRDHGKSRKCAFYAAWEIVRDPATTIIYGSATAEKAEEQLRFIKNILTSEIVFRYFPGLINPKEQSRTAWNAASIIVDHPLRLQEGVVDSTLMTCGLDKTITGKHCKRLILDDIVVPENNTIQGRKDVNSWVAQAASIMSADSSCLAVGTRYHPKDAYSVMMDMVVEATEDKNGEVVNEAVPLFLVNMANVERDGEFLWPRQQRNDGKWFGFNEQILARKRAVYEASGEITQFFAQYYNDPNDRTTAPISRDMFRYYDREDMRYSFGTWELEGRPIYMYAAIDLAASVGDKSDYTVITVGGIDTLGNRYAVQVDRFRTDKISVIHQRALELYDKYHFKKLRVEAVGGFRLVATDLMEHLQKKGIRIPMDVYVPPNQDSKAARIHNILEPLYQAGAVYHYRGGNCQVLEEELVSINPAHDDTKDSWAMCVDLMEPPRVRKNTNRSNVIMYHPKYGGIAL